MVLQEPFLFTGTVFENIRYHKADATREDVIEAAKARRRARLHHAPARRLRQRSASAAATCRSASAS